MKCLPLFSFLIAVLLSACGTEYNYSAFNEIQSGTFTGESYTNESLGMRMDVPLGWVAKPDPNEDSGPGTSDQAQRLKRRKRIFFICKEAMNCNNSMLGVVQDTSYARGANTTEKYYQYLIDQHNTSQEKLGMVADYKRSAVEIGGRDFDMLAVSRVDKEGRPLNLAKEIYFRTDGPNLMQITLNFESEKDKAVLKKTLNSIRFEE